MVCEEKDSSMRGAVEIEKLRVRFKDRHRILKTHVFVWAVRVRKQATQAPQEATGDHTAWHTLAAHASYTTACPHRALLWLLLIIQCVCMAVRVCQYNCMSMSTGRLFCARVCVPIPYLMVLMMGVNKEQRAGKDLRVESTNSGVRNKRWRHGTRDGDTAQEREEPKKKAYRNRRLEEIANS